MRHKKSSQKLLSSRGTQDRYEKTCVPSREEFLDRAQNERVIAVSKKILGDTFTPIALYQILAENQAGSFLLESASTSSSETTWSRYSFIGLTPAATVFDCGHDIRWTGTVPEGVLTEGSIIDVLKATTKILSTDYPQGGSPLASGLAGYLGWDVIDYVEPGLTQIKTNTDNDIPMAAFNLIQDIVIFDNKDSSVTLVSNAINFNDLSSGADEAYDRAISRIQAMEAKLSAGMSHQAVSLLNFSELDIQYMDEKEHESYAYVKRDAYLKIIEQCKEDIKNGEVYQIVISRRFDIPFDHSALDLYRALRLTNPSPYMFLFNFVTLEAQTPYSLVGASPEALVTVKQGHIQSHPIAGSRPRGKTVTEDQYLEEQLLDDEKERAEHVMLVDLVRNDLARVSQYGKAAVKDYAFIEKFSHIMHISSIVDTYLDPRYDIWDGLLSAFPAGTLSGAPKIRALELIEKYEPTSRSAYGGVVGYCDFSGNLDMAITIRSGLIMNKVLYTQSGAGIVFDSDPEAEYQETLSKTRSLMNASKKAHFFVSES